MPVTRNDLIRALHNSLNERHGAMFAQSLQLTSQKGEGGHYGRAYTTKYWLTKHFRKKDNIWICLIFPARTIPLLQIIEIIYSF